MQTYSQGFSSTEGQLPLEVPSSPGVFENATGFSVHGSHFTNVQGGFHVHPVAPQAVAQRPEPAGTTSAFQSRIAQDAGQIYSESETYCSQLWGRRRGFPLFVPEPRRNLPLEYQEKGVSIGDVGMVTPEGIWDFFFNIFLPADHPINGNNVPDGFSPLNQYRREDVIDLNFEPGSYVPSSSVESWNPHGNFDNFPGGEFIFNCEGPTGAVLALPHGSYLEKLANHAEMQQHAAQNAASWYQYINGVRGRQMANGGLYLVTGCEKCFDGGIATFQRPAAGNFSLAFRPFQDPQTGYKYRFDRGTPALTKTFSAPMQSANRALTSTIFIHGCTISLGEGLWGRLFGQVGLSSIMDSPFRKTQGGYVPFSSSSSLSSFFSFNFFSGRGSAGKQHSTRDQDIDGVTIHELSAPPKIIHPSRVINDYIISKVPHADVVITHDDDWSDTLCDDDGQTVTMLNLIQEIMEHFEIREENGVAGLVTKRISAADELEAADHKLATPHQPKVAQPVDEWLDLIEADTLPPNQNETELPFLPSPSPRVRLPSTHKKDGNQKRKPSLACLFCRGRKISCGPSIGYGPSRGCNQCQRRSLECVYPTEPRGKMRKKTQSVVEATVSVASGPKV